MFPKQFLVIVNYDSILQLLSIQLVPNSSAIVLLCTFSFVLTTMLLKNITMENLLKPFAINGGWMPLRAGPRKAIDGMAMFHGTFWPTG